MVPHFLLYFALVCSIAPFSTLGKATIRFMPNTGGSSVFGIIQVKYNGIWGTVCNDDWDMKDLLVACRQLGFGRAVGTIIYGSGKGPVLLNYLGCTGLESSLEECTHSDWGASSSECNRHVHDIGVVCSGHTGWRQKNSTLRLQPGTEGFGFAGWLQIFINNQWGPVCHSSWDITDTKVACRQLGFSNTEAFALYERKGAGKVWMQFVHCTGQEKSLQKCPHSKSASDYGVSIVCSGLKNNVRLVGGFDTIEGRIEIKLEGTWGTVCGDYGWTLENSNVICKMLGHKRAITNRKFGAGNKTSPIWLQEVSCKGCEMSMVECQTTDYSLPKCNHENDAGVVCLPKGVQSCFQNTMCYKREANITVRLVDKDANFIRRVEVRYHGIWRSLCTNNWDIQDAHVICKMAGYQKAAVAMATRKGTNDRLWLDYLDCSGNEATIEDCKNVTWNWENKPCSDELRAGVVCWKDKVKLQFHIVKGETDYAGKLEVEYYGTRGDICMHNLDMNTAHVICRMLGYHEAVTVSSWSQQSMVIFPLSLRCNGSESSTDECATVSLTKKERCYNNEAAGIVCKTNTEINGNEELRLVGGSGDHEGRVEGHENSTLDCGREGVDKTILCSHKNDVGVVCYSEKGYLQVSLEMDNSSSLYDGRVMIMVNNETGTIDDDQWDIHGAHVVCRMLKLPKAIAAISLFRGEPGKVFFSKVRCNGTEESLEMCNHGGWGADILRGYDAGVICDRSPVAQAKMMVGAGSNDGAVTGLSILIVILIMFIAGAFLWYFMRLRNNKNKDSDKIQDSGLQSGRQVAARSEDNVTEDYYQAPPPLGDQNQYVTNQENDRVVRHTRERNARNIQENEDSMYLEVRR